MLTLSTAGAWALAKLVGAKAALGRFFNGSALAALALVLVFVGLLIVGAVVLGRIESGAAAIERGKSIAERLAATVRWNRAVREVKQKADAAVAAERDEHYADIRTYAEHAASLERALAAALANPQCYSPDVAKELRR